MGVVGDVAGTRKAGGGGGGGMELLAVPPAMRRSRSKDRRGSMSLIDAMFRRRRRPSVSDRIQQSSDSEASTGPAVF